MWIPYGLIEVLRWKFNNNKDSMVVRRFDAMYWM